jgi:hypothetical protein
VKKARSENHAPIAPAMLRGSAELPDVDQAASAALCVTSASSASSHSTPPTITASFTRHRTRVSSGAPVEEAGWRM